MEPIQDDKKAALTEHDHAAMSHDAHTRPEDSVHDHSAHEHSEHEGHTMPMPTAQPINKTDTAANPHAGHAMRKMDTISGMDHASRDEHAGHGSPDDMLRRFIISLVVTIPIVLFSPIGAGLGFHLPPPFGLSMEWFGLVLSSFVVWWCGWPFINSAWGLLRRGEVGMMTLIALGILVSYLYSVAATLFWGGDVFFEAAAMLTTFSLAGHWLETR